MTRMHAVLETEWDRFREDYLMNCAETGQPPARTVDELWQMFRADFPPKFGLRGNGYVYCKQCKSPFEPHLVTDGKCADCHATLANMIALGMANNRKKVKADGGE